MKITKCTILYFSPTGSCEKIAQNMANSMKFPVVVQDLLEAVAKDNQLTFEDNEWVIVVLPVFAGRIPALTEKALKKIHFSNTIASAVVVYGNRAYEDALLELNNSLTQQNATVISAGVFLAQHSLFPEVARNRPNKKDINEIQKFTKDSVILVNKITESNILNKSETSLQIPGNYPYRDGATLPLTLSTNSDCITCGLCAQKCPVQAIPVDYPNQTIAEICIDCGRCITICPQKARSFTGEVYEKFNQKLITNCSEAKSNETFFITLP